MGIKKYGRYYALASLLVAVFLIVAEEATGVEFFGEALLGLICIVLIGSSVGGMDKDATEMPVEDAEIARRLSKPSF